jgi:hypothetical protein
VQRWNNQTVANTTTAGVQASSSVAALPDGGYVVVWYDETGYPNTRIAGQRFDATGQKVGGEFYVSPPGDAQLNDAPSVTATFDGGFAVSWTDQQSSPGDYDILMQRFDSSGQAVGSFFRASGSFDDERDSEVAHTSTGMALVYRDASVNNGDIFLSIVTFNGTTQTASTPVVVNSLTTGNQTDPDIIQLKNGNLVVAWASTDGATDLRFRIYGSDGTPISSQDRLIDSTEFPLHTRLAALANGNFVVTYDQDLLNGNPVARAAILDSSGNFVVYPFTMSSARGESPEVVPLEDGGFVAFWFDQDRFQIRGEVFAPNGQREGSEFVLDAPLGFSTGDGHPISAAMLADGRIIVTLTHSYGGSEYNILQQIIDPRDGVVNGTSSHNDLLCGSDLANDDMAGFGGDDVFHGMKGNDRIDGGDGVDAAVFSGVRSAYAVSTDDTSNVVQGPDGYDQLNNVERLAFDNGTFNAHFVGTDINGDSSGDVMFRNASTGHMFVWNMVNRARTQVDLGASNAQAHVAGVGDFNDDGTTDVLMRNDSNGTVSLWEMHNNVRTVHALGGSGVSYHVAGIGDFNLDGTSDVLWRDDSTGSMIIWEMHNGVPTPRNLPNSAVAAHVAGIGDFNGDGTSDILLRNDANGNVSVWEMHNDVPTVHLLGGSALAYHVVGTGDFNGDGTTDIVWRDDTSGATGIWEMHNEVATWHDYGITDVNHKIVATGDYDGDGITDIFWRDNSTGHSGFWHMDNFAATWVDLGTSATDHMLVA